MTHPFFDAITYPWHRSDARQLLQVLTDLVGDQPEIKKLYQSSADALPPLTPARADLMWTEALENLAAGCGLQQLCELLLDRPLHPHARKAIMAVLNALVGIDGPDPLESPDIVILDRSHLRQRIRQLTPAQAPLKVLLVRGGPDSGKSHGRFLFQRAADAQNAQPVYLYASTVANVTDVIEELFGALGATDQIPISGDTTSSAYYRVVWRRLRGIVQLDGRALWIAIDDLGDDPDGAPLVDTEVRLFLDQLVLHLLNPLYAQWFRLMLIHYPDGKVPTRWTRDVWAEDRTSEDDVQQEHVAEILRSWSARHGATVVEEEINSLAADIVAEADAPQNDKAGGSCRLERINDLVTEALKRLVGTNL